MGLGAVLSSPTPNQTKVQAGRIGGYTTAARHDSRTITARARETFLASFVDQVDPDRVLPEQERLRRAEAARRAHFTRLAMQSAAARRSRKGGAA